MKKKKQTNKLLTECYICIVSTKYGTTCTKSWGFKKNVKIHKPTRGTSPTYLTSHSIKQRSKALNIQISWLNAIMVSL